ncbi:hypothetical protein Q31a_10200 [Aureliella helgolandensis]|uniref:Uncharacterized protein n=2 Tax=Aureliella helgolandensis TaxID=2527968 RepID=A0A518G2C4_9BACT|nr:hypothetical protein Q31a_10200 [Aureliella helgolandensis]
MYFALTCFLICCISATNGDEIASQTFRTDDNVDKTLAWYQLKQGEFPPQGAAHAISGELIRVDHLERQFYLRVDRDDSQQRGIWDLPIDATMLPYGAIYYHGAPAALQDIPLGTHLHGLFYRKAADDKSPPPPGPYGRATPDVDFNRCFELEDDFSHNARQQRLWRIDAVDLDEMSLTATLHKQGQDIGLPLRFDLLSHTRVFLGNRMEDLNAMEPGTLVQLNITWATLYGPGRVSDVWLDESSRQLASHQQLMRHHNHIRERGLPGWVDAVDDESQVVTITFFGGVDPKLFDELTGINEEPQGWPFSAGEDDPKAPKGGIAVALESLMTYDPVNDRKGGNILSITQGCAEPGSSGIQIKVKCGMLLEGFRPRRIVRFYPATWKVQALPREEQFFGRE